MGLGYKSHIGKVRTINQDAFLVLDDEKLHLKIFAVADGLGGHNAGEVASNTLIDGIKAFLFTETIIDDSKLDEGKVVDLIQKMNTEIFEMGNENSNLNKMGTTLSLSIIMGDTVNIFHVGDSRTYIVNQKEILQLTNDHSLVEQLVLQGEISKEEAMSHPNRNVLTRAIGTDENIEVDFYKYTIKKSDKVLLCTDGLTNLVGKEEIKDIINSSKDCQKAVDRLIDKANENGGYDNITVIVYDPEVSI